MVIVLPPPRARQAAIWQAVGLFVRLIAPANLDNRRPCELLQPFGSSHMPYRRYRMVRVILSRTVVCFLLVSSPAYAETIDATATARPSSGRQGQGES